MTILFSGCLPEGNSGCPGYLTVSFDLDDEYEEGNFDSRIGNDIVLYVFRDGKCLQRLTVPYDEVRGGKEYRFRKSLRMHGDLHIVAWTVSSEKGDSGSIPDWVENDQLEYLRLEMPARTGASDCMPTANELYMGMETFYEKVDSSSARPISLQHVACRVEVNVSDATATLSSAASRIALYGSMTAMDMWKNGVGEEAVVHTQLRCPDGNGKDYTSGRFGILPSAQYQTIAVDIISGDAVIATLTVPRDRLPQGAVSGGLMIFDYSLGDNEFWITVDGYRQKIVIVDGI